MTLTLDTRAPTIVLVAMFNPAIFQPTWIARHLFDKGEGEDMAIMEMIGQNGADIIQMSFFEGVAFNVESERTQMFTIDGNVETLGNLEKILLKMLNVLPHTPLSAIGCNFTFVDDAPLPAITSLFETREALEGEGKLNLRQSGVQLLLDGSEVVNFNRIMTEQNVRYTFNYHRPETDIIKYHEFLPGWISKSLKHSENILKSYYGYDHHEIIGFMTEPQQGNDENVIASTN